MECYPGKFGSECQYTCTVKSLNDDTFTIEKCDWL